MTTTHLPRFPVLMLSLAIVSTVCVLLWFGTYTFYNIQALRHTLKHDFRAIELRGLIMQLDEVLTMSARMGVVTGDMKWEQRYNHYDPILSHAIDEAGTLVPFSNLGETSKKTEIANNKLVAMERQSFDLAKQGKTAEAKKIMFGPDYDAQKNIYASGMTQYSNLLQQQAQSHLQSQIRIAYYSLSIILATTIILVFSWIIIYRSISRWKKISEQTNKLMVEEIAERKHAESKAATLNNQLVIAARRAGMADIATSVLHNIGNVLNSINVSASLVSEKITALKISSLNKTADMLDQHKNDIAAFIANDPQGQHIIKYIKLFAEAWEKNEKIILMEIEALRKNVQHVKEIIKTQQTLSGAIGLIEEVTIPELLEDSLTLNKTAYERSLIKITRDYATLPCLQIDRVKLLQILVNLIRNAIDSLMESKNETKNLAIHARLHDPTHILIQIIDNGLGIAPDDINSIFSRGFTTKKHGHGFGLHASALAAKEMGGSLSVKSDGPGKGAIFNLLLPIQPIKNKEDQRPINSAIET